MTIDITTLYVCLDDFCKLYENAVQSKALPNPDKRIREGYLSLSEMLLIAVYYHFSPFKDFKRYYIYGICHEHKDKFKKLPTYHRFIALKKRLFVPLSILLNNLFGDETGIYFADSTTLEVCHNKRICRHKVFKDMAARGKSTMGWFYGLKLHIIINHKGEIMAIKITAGNVDDRKALVDMVKNLRGKCFADKGYIGKDIFKTLWARGLHLITGIKKNMKQILCPLIDKLLLRKRFIVETIFGFLKTEFNLQHSRHRSSSNALVHILAALVAYSFKNNKPQINGTLLKSYP